MKTSYLFLADGFEELEALSPIDVLRRGGMPLTTVSINPGSEYAVGAHGVTVKADAKYGDVDFSDADWLILPGGMPGTQNLADFGPLADLLVLHHQQGKNIAAICASPALVLAPLGIIEGRAATCYPGMENLCTGANMTDAFVVKSGNVVTGQGPAAAIDFALTILGETKGVKAAEEVAAGMLKGRH